MFKGEKNIAVNHLPQESGLEVRMNLKLQASRQRTGHVTS